MSNRWSIYRHELSKKSHHQRHHLYLDFCKLHPKLSERVKSALYVVVVNLEPQSFTAAMAGVPKQVVNRIVRKYRDFLLV
jgi:hypothetical protein